MVNLFHALTCYLSKFWCQEQMKCARCSVIVQKKDEASGPRKTHCVCVHSARLKPAPAMVCRIVHTLSNGKGDLLSNQSSRAIRVCGPILRTMNVTLERQA
ncbi:hypothetical protein BT96DRAFT_412858 [Gymnopus androsaceus JB14]|uniref:Uncharacterized protein n=1 Tax=Gymnopus androsaceus JB14 TaxID=1447944 RepID=A0A6A4I1P7_9AGAR|nr:hypothetical protein BT96DRAFT_412858 [Gymnopus androsaceus JB14]